MKAIGIDLGTTNSVACVSEGHSIRVLLNSTNEELTPSVVSCQKFEEDEEATIVVGRSAVTQAKLYPEDTIFSIKRLMGRAYNDENVQQWKERVGYQVRPSTEPVAGRATVVMGGKEYLPEDISALILGEIKRYSGVALGSEITHAVITVPAYFREPERAATREAGQKAGLVVKTLLPEPTAAAIAFGTQARSDEGSMILVFDLGGGTFDISILSVVGDNYNVMEVYGDHFLGGDDFDEAIIDMLLKHVRQTHGVDLSGDRRFRIIAKSEAEAAKKSLSSLTTDSTTILIPDAARVGDKNINVRMKITRQEFERAIKPLVDRCCDLVQEALARQSLTPELISDVLLVGGSTAVPLVYRSMEKLFGAEKVRRNINPMHCVAIGAGIYASRMKGIECPRCHQVRDEAESTCGNCGEWLVVASPVYEGIEVTEITTNQFGVQVVSGSDPYHFRPLVDKGQILPLREPGRDTLLTAEENQTLIRVPVYEGLGSNVMQNAPIGAIEYNLPVGLPKNHPVHIEMWLDRHSMVTVVIEVEGYDFKYKESFKRNVIDLPAADPQEEEPLIDEEGEDELDEQEKNLAILEIYLNRARQFATDYGNILSPAEKRRLEGAIEEGQEIFDSDRAAEAIDATMKLDRLLLRCGTASLIEQARLAADSADEETAQKLHQAADELHRMAERRENASIARATPPLASLIRQVHQRARGIEKIETAKRYGGLLRHGQESRV